ncbi:hypothetical protein ACH5A3_21485 [Streptomyces echinatus]|uniref:hypothetical protein n=1 Tax=Streptomyces echinatus TaxID=67293 RepID=UPI0037B47F87
MTAPDWTMSVTLQAGDEAGSARFTCVPQNSPLTISGVVKATGRGIVITSMEWTTDTESGITAGMNRDFRVGELLAYIRTAREFDEMRRSLGLQLPPVAAAEPPPRPRRGGRPSVDDETMRALALAYLEETAHGKPSGSVGRLASRFGRPEETIRTWLARARKDGWLTAAVKGRRGAEAGPRLRGETL